MIEFHSQYDPQSRDPHSYKNSQIDGETAYLRRRHGLQSPKKPDTICKSYPHDFQYWQQANGS